MKQTISLLFLVTVMVGCGAKKYERPPTTYEQKIAKLDEKAARWAAEEKTLKFYNLGYTRRTPEEVYYVDMDIVGGEVQCRRKVGMKTGEKIEVGDEVGSNDWGDTPIVTLPEIYEECRKSLKKNPDAEFTFNMGGDLLWCEGNFGVKGAFRGVVSLGTKKPVCYK